MDEIVLSGIAVVLFLFLAFGLGLLFALPVMWFANYLFTPTFLLSVFGAAKLTFWKAYILSVFLSWTFRSKNSK